MAAIFVAMGQNDTLEWGRNPAYYYHNTRMFESGGVPLMRGDLYCTLEAPNDAFEMTWPCSAIKPLPVVGLACMLYDDAEGDTAGFSCDTIARIRLYDDSLNVLRESYVSYRHPNRTWKMKVLHQIWSGETFGDYAYLPLYECYFDTPITLQGPFRVGFRTVCPRSRDATLWMGTYICADATYPMTLDGRGNKWLEGQYRHSGMGNRYETSQRIPYILPIIDTNQYEWTTTPSRCGRPYGLTAKPVVRHVWRASEDDWDVIEEVYSPVLDVSWNLPDGATGTRYTLRCNGGERTDSAYKGFSINYMNGAPIQPGDSLYLTLQSIGTGFECDTSDVTEEFVVYYDPDVVPDTILWGTPPVNDTSSVGIPEVDDMSDLVAELTCLMPNPARGRVTVASSFGLRSVEVYDLMGHRRLSRHLSGYGETLDISTLTAGTYLFRVETTQGVVTKKLLVE